jgi:hypothetical protein
MYRTIDWPKLINATFHDAEQALIQYNNDPAKVADTLFNKAIPSYSYGSQSFVREAPEGETDADSWVESVDRNSIQSGRSFGVALERVMGEIETGDIIVGWKR